MYKECCGQDEYVIAAQTRNKIVLVVVIVAVVAATFINMYRQDLAAKASVEIPEGAVYDKEHRHWHDAEDRELRIPGKVWDYGQERFVNAPEKIGDVYPQPAGAPPPGKVWSPVHGHWHDAEPEAETAR